MVEKHRADDREEIRRDTDDDEYFSGVSWLGFDERHGYVVDE
jgi:hypothetical protein